MYRHVLWGGAFAAGTFMVCAIAERRRPAVVAGSLAVHNRERWWYRDQTLLELHDESLLDRVLRRLHEASETTRTVLAISAANVAVFGLWSVPLPGVQRFMKSVFVSNPSSRRLLPHLLSGFSHRSLGHLAFNMMALWSFGSSVCEVYGREQFCFVYLTSLVGSSIVSHAYASRIARSRPSLGASGGVLAVVAMFTALHPDRELIMLFLPFISFPAWMGLAGLAAFDSAGVVLGWQLFDHAAHLGGILLGYAYGVKLHQWTWDQRRTITDLIGIGSKGR